MCDNRCNQERSFYLLPFPLGKPRLGLRGDSPLKLKILACGIKRGGYIFRRWERLQFRSGQMIYSVAEEGEKNRNHRPKAKQNAALCERKQRMGQKQAHEKRRLVLRR